MGLWSTPSGNLICYHATYLSDAQRILRWGFQMRTQSDGEWLGRGHYFWVGDIDTAIDYIRSKASRQLQNRERLAVLRCEVDPAGLLDLTHIRSKEMVRTAASNVVDHLSQPAKERLRKQSIVQRRLDAWVMETAKAMTFQPGGQPHTGALAVFGRPLIHAADAKYLPGITPPVEPLLSLGHVETYLSLHDHIQLVVWDTSAIKTVEFAQEVSRR